MFLSCLFGGRSAVASELKLGAGTTLTFASQEAGRKILLSRDAFVQRLSPFDRASRLHTDRAVSEKEFLQHLSACVQEWSAADQANVAAAWASIRPALEAMALPFPDTVTLISTTGQDEGGAAYTRGRAIVLPPDKRADKTPALARLLAHELLHVLTRHDPALRDQLYACIGFVPCPELAFPVELRARRITNPDAPELRHRIRLTVEGLPAWAIPVLYSATDNYDVAGGGEFFDYLRFELLLVEAGAQGASSTAARFEDNKPLLIPVGAAPDFLAQVGRNTSYIIHAEEILAENFALLVLGAEGVPSPDVLARIKQVLAAARVSP